MKNQIEVRNHHVDDENNTFIDAYLPNKEEGIVVAIVCNQTNKVFTIDKTYINNKSVKEAIMEVKLRNNLTLETKLSNLKDEVEERFVNVCNGREIYTYKDYVSDEALGIDEIVDELKNNDQLDLIEAIYINNNHGVEKYCRPLVVSEDIMLVYDCDDDEVITVGYINVNGVSEQISLVSMLEEL